MAAQEPDEGPKDKDLRCEQQKWSGAHPRLPKDQGFLYQEMEFRYKKARDVIITSREQIK